jgi:nucleoside-diphosphate-sugar epimerase
VSAPIAAVAGATGFVGRRLCGRLVERGWSVRSLVRTAPLAGDWLASATTTVQGDLSDVEALRRLAEGARVCINSAGLVKAGSPAAFKAVNAVGAGRFAAIGDARHILISSLAAREPQLSAYAASKQAGEIAARAAAGGRLAVLRPPVIYGPGDRETLALFRFAQRSPIAPVPADRRARLALTHVEEVVDAALALIERPELGGVYAVGGHRPDGYAWVEIAKAAWGALGRNARIVTVPAWAVRAAGLATDSLAGGRPAIFGRGKAAEILHPDWAIGSEEVMPSAPTPQFDLGAGFADAVAWYRRAGWLGP